MVSPELSGPSSPCPDTNLGPETAAGSTEQRDEEDGIEGRKNIFQKVLLLLKICNS